VAAVAQRYGQR